MDWLTADILAAYFDKLITLVAGIWITVTGFRQPVLPPEDGWRRTLISKMHPHFRWMGPLLIIVALIQIVTVPR